MALVITPENALARIPDMSLAQHKFTLLNGSTPAAREAAKKALWEAINADDMAPFYRHVCEEAKIPLDSALVSKLEANNTKRFAELDEKLKTAQESEGETEISDALIAKADYLAKIGEKDKAVSAYRTAFEKTPGVGAKIDLVFSQIRIGLFFNDRTLITQQLEKAKALIEEGGDWDRRNRCKLMEMKDFVTYTVLMSVISVPRVEIKSKLLESPEVLEVVHQVPHLEAYMRALYDCHYNQFFQTLAHMEVLLKSNYYLHLHYPFYVREMRIKAYAQLLESYRSLTLEYMAAAFGVSQEFIDRDLYKFIAGGRLNCVIDKVRGIVETNRPDHKNAQYQAVIKQGDTLLNRVQKLSRVINI
ncbi:26S proteasome non-ATPase regulatory subunit 6 [Catenaria anguillulae PL171]|uniref:26S proteasome non-ATPase regulatory subunit 6 n=1 Tax=Catenaria anguillulae PL171 TaxID=765915 RepID=A0A1Y2HY52_9FUNG|nr:26S proteasome non-ATPase regulatory subunit 6 [Catenaria anguillulae PL171]